MYKIMKNKHVVLSMLIAPILAIVTYIATDEIVSDPPIAADKSASYPLAAKSNCRYESGRCTLVNGDVELNLRAEILNETHVVLTADVSLDLDNLMLSIGLADADILPRLMGIASKDKKRWELTVPTEDMLSVDKTLDNLVVRVVAQAQGSAFYAETSAKFLKYETIFSRENFTSLR